MATRPDGVVRRTPPFDSAEALPDVSRANITGERFHSRAWMEREWARLWRRVWNLACRESDLPEPGDFFVYEFGKESFLFVRGDDGRLRGFFNVCQHRGNRLVLGGEGCGHGTHFACSYHGWQWNVDGSIRHVADAETFPRFAVGLPEADLGLEPVEVDVWGGWVWFRMDTGGPSLQDYLHPVPQHLDAYGIEDWALIDYKSFDWPCNWKAACDAFNETYHFRTLHAQTMAWANGTAEIELLDIHSRMANQYLTVDPKYPDQESLNPGLRTFMEKIYRLDPESYEGRPQDVRLELQRHKRAREDTSWLPYRNLADEQLSDTFHYTVFPNVSWNLTAESIIGFRYRPHASDPARCTYDLFILRAFDPDRPPKEYEYHHYGLGEAPPRMLDALGIRPEPMVIDPIDQDAGVLPHVQKGLSSDGFRGMVLSQQEARVWLFHKVLDEYLNGER